MSKPSDTLARLRARPSEAGRFVLPLDPVWVDKLTEAYRAVRQAELVDDPDEREDRLATARTTVAELEAAAGNNVVVFRFRRLSRAQYDGLITRNPPTPEQRKEDEGKLPHERRLWNADTLAPDMLAMVLIDPPMEGPEEASAFLEATGDDGCAVLGKGEAEALLIAAQSAALSAPRMAPRELALP